jgi:hypothetical protein
LFGRLTTTDDPRRHWYAPERLGLDARADYALRPVATQMWNRENPGNVIVFAGLSNIPVV